MESRLSKEIPLLTPKFPAASPSLHAAIRARVAQQFQLTESETKGNRTLFLKAAFILSSTLGLYIHLVFFTPHWYFAVPECLLLGLCIAGIGFNIMHDGSHGSFSSHRWLNALAGGSLECLGGSAFLWKIKHCTIHHTYTNVEGIDDDIDIGSLMRLNEHQSHRRLHRFQHLYVWALYMVFYISWIAFTDYQKYFSHRIGSVAIARMKPADHIRFWTGKLLNIAIYFVIPIVFAGFLPWLAGFLLAACTTGVTTALVFQLAHTVEHTDFPVPSPDTNLLPDEFALHQIGTTANFATSNRLVTWLVGGLNFQIEHHLFPGISHVHYPAVSRAVRQVCAERNITYTEHPTMRQAIAAHIRHLYALGRV